MTDPSAMNKPPRLLADLARTERSVWAMIPEIIQGMHTRFVSSAHGASEQQFASQIEAKSKSQNSVDVKGNGVAVVPVSGMIVPKLTFMAWLMGADYGLDEIMGMVHAGVSDPDVKAVVLDFDSPGGVVDGVPEAASRLAQLRDQGGKPIVAQANGLCASAAYWLASQCHEVAVTPSGEVGSIGVYQTHKDISGALEGQGIKTTLISAGKYKVEGNPYQPLEGEALQAMQSTVDDYYGMFTSAVAAGRSHLNGQAGEVSQEDVQSGYGEGRTLTAKRAVKANLADRVSTLGDTISRLSSGRAKIRRVAEADRTTLVMDETAPVASQLSADDRARFAFVMAEMGIGKTN